MRGVTDLGKGVARQSRDVLTTCPGFLHFGLQTASVALVAGNLQAVLCAGGSPAFGGTLGSNHGYVGTLKAYCV